MGPPKPRPQSRPGPGGRLRRIAAARAGASAAAAVLIVVNPIEWRSEQAPSEPATPQPAPSVGPGRSATELSEALQGSAAAPPASPATGNTAAEAPAAGAVAWETLTKLCLEDVGKANPRQELRLVESTGFVPKAAEANTRLGFAWDQAVRLNLEPAGGGATMGIECYFQKGALAGKSRA